jgi:hypothetical protein
MADESRVVLRNISPDRAPFVDPYVLHPSDLGLSPTLAGRLEHWSGNRPGLSPEEASARRSWHREGWDLAGLLQQELDHLGYEADIVYEDEGMLRPVHPGRHSAQRLDTTGPQVLLMADYGCFLWTSSPQLFRFRDKNGDLDLARLGASPELVEQLTAWHREWEDTTYGGSPAAAEDDDRDRRGAELARRLQDELGNAIEVWFCGGDEGGIGRPVWELARD